MSLCEGRSNETAGECLAGGFRRLGRHILCAANIEQCVNAWILGNEYDYLEPDLNGKHCYHVLNGLAPIRIKKAFFFFFFFFNFHMSTQPAAIKLTISAQDLSQDPFSQPIRNMTRTTAT
jgi:hypothetical protein